MEKLTLSQIPSVLGYLGRSGVYELIKSIVRKEHGITIDDSAPMEYSRGAKSIAIIDFELETGIDTFDSYCSIKEGLKIKPDAITEFDTPLVISTPYKSNSEFDDANDSPKLYCKAQFVMYCMNKTECMVYQWTESFNRVDVIKFSQDFIDKSKPRIDSFFYELVDARANPEVFIVEEVKDKKQKNMIDSLRKAEIEIMSLEAKKKRLSDFLYEENHGKKVSISGCLVDCTGNRAEIKTWGIK